MFNLPDETLPAFFESIRRRVLADMKLGNWRRLAGRSVKQFAQRLGRELNRRRLPFKPIEWPDG